MGWIRINGQQTHQFTLGWKTATIFVPIFLRRNKTSRASTHFPCMKTRSRITKLGTLRIYAYIFTLYIYIYIDIGCDHCYVLPFFGGELTSTGETITGTHWSGHPGQEKADKPKLAMQLLDLALCTSRPGEPLGPQRISRVLVVFPGVEQAVEDRVDTDG